MVEVLGASRPGVDRNAAVGPGRVSVVVPIGARTLPVSDASSFTSGQVVIVAVPVVDQALVSALRMDKICFPGPITGSATDGWTWEPLPADEIYQWDSGWRSCNSCPFSDQPTGAYQIARGSVLYERTVGTVNAATNELTLIEPTVQRVDPRYGGAWVFPTVTGVSGSLPKASRAAGARARHVGVEDLTLRSAYEAGQETSDEKHAWTAISFDNAEHSWARDVRCEHLGYSCVHAKRGAKHITVDGADSVAPVSRIVGGRRYAFNTDGAFVLMQNLRSDLGRHDYVSGSRAPGPNVWRDAVSTNMQSDIGPHHRWANGQLYENIEGQAENGGYFAVQNRASMGNGHGWAGNAIVFYNCLSKCTSTDRSRCYTGFTVDTPLASSGASSQVMSHRRVTFGEFPKN